MAKIRIEDGDVVVHLSLLEKVAAMRGDVHIPRSAVDSVPDENPGENPCDNYWDHADN